MNRKIFALALTSLCLACAGPGNNSNGNGNGNGGGNDGGTTGGSDAGTGGDIDPGGGSCRTDGNVASCQYPTTIDPQQDCYDLFNGTKSLDDQGCTGSQGTAKDSCATAGALGCCEGQTRVDYWYGTGDETELVMHATCLKPEPGGTIKSWHRIQSGAKDTCSAECCRDPKRDGNATSGQRCGSGRTAYVCSQDVFQASDAQTATGTSNCSYTTPTDNAEMPQGFNVWCCQ